MTQGTLCAELDPALEWTQHSIIIRTRSLEQFAWLKILAWAAYSNFKFEVKFIFQGEICQPPVLRVCKHVM